MAIKSFGDKCLRCGFNDWRALQFDHTVSRNAVYRRKHSKTGKIGDGAGNGEFWKRYREGTAAAYFQLLCANCHAIKTYEEKEHRPLRDAEKEPASDDINELPLFKIAA